MIRSNKESYNQRILDSFKGNPKKFYGHMRSLKTVKVQVTQLTMEDGSLTTDDMQAAEVLCDYFTKVFTKEIDCKDKTTMRSIFGVKDRIVFSE